MTSPHKVILTLDLATRTGWALKNSAMGWEESGVQDFSRKRGESPGMIYVHFRAWLDLMIAGVHLVVYEMPHMRGGAAATLLTGLATRVEEAAAEKGIEYTKAHGANVKKTVLGTGKADKQVMIDWARLRLGRDPIDDNEADALGLMAWAEKTLGV